MKRALVLTGLTLCAALPAWAQVGMREVMSKAM